LKMDDRDKSTEPSTHPFVSSSVPVSGSGESEFEEFANVIKALPAEELDRDTAEMLSEIEFLEAQIDADKENYSPDDLESALEKLSLMKRKADLLKNECERKGKE